MCWNQTEVARIVSTATTYNSADWHAMAMSILCGKVRQAFFLRLLPTAAAFFSISVFSTSVFADEAADELSRQASDPTASLMAFNFITNYTGNFYGPDAGEDDYQLGESFRPVIPFTAFGTSNILRLTIPYHLSGRGQDGIGDVSLFDLVVFGESWGRWGVGAVATFSSDDDAADHFVFGPAVGGVWQYSTKLNLGLFSQNVFGGDTAISQLQPIIAYQLGSGWSVSAGDLQWVYDWKASKWRSLPVGAQLGKVTKWGNQAVRWAVNPQYNFADDPGNAGWSLSFTFALLVPSK